MPQVFKVHSSGTDSSSVINKTVKVLKLCHIVKGVGVVDQDAGASIVFHTSDETNTTDSKSKYADKTRESASIANILTDVGDNTVTGQFAFKLLKGNSNQSTPDTRLILNPGTASETSNNSLILVNPDGSDAADSRKSNLIFRGFNGSSESGDIATISAAHEGDADDHRGYINIAVNDGNDTSNNLQNVMKIGPKVEYDSGTITASTSDSVTLGTSASATENDYQGKYIQITGGTGSGQTRNYQ